MTTRPAPVLASFVAVAALLVAPLLAPPARAEAPLQRVAAARVCMVNDNLFPKDQIPVEVSGKTYFGCCEMCKDRLASDASLRTATDPVSKKQVDKATAVIGARPDGRVIYFENAANFERYQKTGAGS
jgi:YHS domain-containing protein